MNVSRSLIVRLVVYAVLFGLGIIPNVVHAADVDCNYTEEVIQEPNVFRWKLDCPPQAEAGYHLFEFGDGAFFDVYLDTNGDSPEFTHGYSYGSGITTYEAGLDYDNFTGLDFTFPITIDVRPAFYVGVNPTQHNPTSWDWEYSIRDTGVFTAFVNTSCNGMAGNHQGVFQWQLDGPEEGNQFGNWVESYFIETGLVTTTLTISDSTNSVVWTQDILAPSCKVKKPVIQVQEGPYHYMDLVKITVMAPEGANSMLITAGGMPFSEYPLECQAQPASAPVTGLSCTPGTRQVEFRINKMDAQTVTVFSRSWFSPYNIESHATLSLEVSDDEGVEPTCDMSITRVSDVDYRFDYNWSNASEEGGHILDFGFVTKKYGPLGFSGIEGTGVHTQTYPFYTPGQIVTTTLTIEGEEEPAICNEFVVMPETLPDPTCAIEIIEGDTFNQRKFVLSWTGGYARQINSDTLGWQDFEFGDGTETQLAGDTGQQVDSYKHDYSWDTQTGRSTYTAKMTVFGYLKTVTCEELFEIVDPNWMPSLDFEEFLFIPKLGK